MRNMSFALTKSQIKARTKDVTRRLGWLQLKPGDLFMPVEKCMGLRPGEKIQYLQAEPLRVVSTRRERLDLMTSDLDYGFDEVRREGFEDHPQYGWPSTWVEMFCNTHKGCKPASVITRIEFAYVDAVAKKGGAPMLTPERIQQLAFEHLRAYAQFVGSGDVWFEGEEEFARAVEAESRAAARAEVEPLVRQMLEALENERLLAPQQKIGLWGPARKAARAWLSPQVGDKGDGNG